MGKNKLWWLKAVVSFGLLGYLLTIISWGQLFSVLLQGHLRWFIYALIAGLGQIIVSAWRWQLLLKLLVTRSPPLSVLTYYYFVSSFFNNFAPANLVGDASRIGSLFNEGEDFVVVTTSVVIERILNLAVLCLLMIWVIACQPLTISLQFNSDWLSFELFGIVASIMLVAGLFMILIRKKLPQKTNQIHFLANLIEQPFGVMSVVITTLFLHFVIMLITYSTFQAVNVPVSLEIHLAVYTIAGLVLTLPISIQGIGVREGIYLSLFGLVSVAKESVLAALALNYGVLIFFSVVGGLIFWLNPYRLSSRGR